MTSHLDLFSPRFATFSKLNRRRGCEVNRYCLLVRQEDYKVA